MNKRILDIDKLIALEKIRIKRVMEAIAELLAQANKVLADVKWKE